jgi:uncharacterized protein
MDPAIPRLLPDVPLPRYAHVPGRTPHPISDPRGHSYGLHAAIPAAPDPEHWEACREYLRGLDLFNAGYWWESHEAWEGVWRACGRSGPAADFLKGLIKLAAAGVKRRQGQPDGVSSHARRAAALVKSAPTTPFFGLDVPGLIALAESIALRGWPENGPRLHPRR